MPYVFQSKDQVGKPHARWRFQYTDFKGRRRTGTKQHLGNGGRTEVHVRA